MNPPSDAREEPASRASGASSPPFLPLRGRIDLSERILSVSSTLVGVCLTVIGLVRVAEELKKVSSATDEIVAYDAVAFLAACLFAYASIRSRDPRAHALLERIADYVFLAALVGMVVVGGVLAYELV